MEVLLLVLVRVPVAKLQQLPNVLHELRIRPALDELVVRSKSGSLRTFRGRDADHPKIVRRDGQGQRTAGAGDRHRNGHGLFSNAAEKKSNSHCMA